MAPNHSSILTTMMIFTPITIFFVTALLTGSSGIALTQIRSNGKQSNNIVSLAASTQKKSDKLNLKNKNENSTRPISTPNPTSSSSPENLHTPTATIKPEASVIPKPTFYPTQTPAATPMTQTTPLPTILPTAIPTASPLPIPDSGNLIPATPIASPESSPSATNTPVPDNSPDPETSPSPIPSPSAGPQATAVPDPSPKAEPVSNSFWQLRSIDAMKETKDIICNQRSVDFVNRWVETAKELGVTHIAISTPYESPVCGDAYTYTKIWADSIHNAGLNVWHRHMPLEFEGIYGSQKDPGKDFLSQIAVYIQSHPEIFAEGDIFTPIAEPQNGGIRGVSYCAQDICMFESAAHFNSWLRNATVSTKLAFETIGLGSAQVKVGYWGFDGFIAWGDNNPDWQGKSFLEDATVSMMGNITIDHYPELVGSTMEQDLNELHQLFPQIPIVIGEWGTVTGGDVSNQVISTMKAAQRPYIIGFNYWHMGTGGHEALINEDFSKNEHFYNVAALFH